MRKRELKPAVYYQVATWLSASEEMIIDFAVCYENRAARKIEVLVAVVYRSVMENLLAALELAEVAAEVVILSHWHCTGF